MCNLKVSVRKVGLKDQVIFLWKILFIGVSVNTAAQQSHTHIYGAADVTESDVSSAEL